MARPGAAGARSAPRNRNVAHTTEPTTGDLANDPHVGWPVAPGDGRVVAGPVADEEAAGDEDVGAPHDERRVRALEAQRALREIWQLREQEVREPRARRVVAVDGELDAAEEQAPPVDGRGRRRRRARTARWHRRRRAPTAGTERTKASAQTAPATAGAK